MKGVIDGCGRVKEEGRNLASHQAARVKEIFLASEIRTTFLLAAGNSGEGHG